MSIVTELFDAVASTAPSIRAALPGRREYIDGANPSGEDVLAADQRADELLQAAIGDVDGVGRYASEERETVENVGSGLAVTCDPLDGSSNLESNNAMGTVVGVYDAPLPARGRELVAAGYVLYGPITTMVTASGGDVQEWLVTDDGRRKLGEPTLPEEPTVYGFGGRRPDWPDPFEAYASEIESELKLRYGGAMVGDVNQVVTYGGVFSYPGLQSRPEGKLRLQYEANPMAYVIEAAGGASSDGDGSILDAPATDLHQRTPVHVGSPSLIDRLETHLS